MRWVRWPSLPLFSKELIEQSNRRRTFVVRMVYAALLYAFLMFYLWEKLGGWNANSIAFMGRGREIFETLVGLQFFAIYAFLPGLTCGVLTAEKERDTLAMLLLTKLGPWTILLEKLLSRLMPMGLLLLLSLPLLAVAYSLGGVETHMLVSAVWVLGLTAVQVGALALFCSAWFRTTAGAFVGIYVIGFCLFFLPAWLAHLGFPFFRQLAMVLAAVYGRTYPGPAEEYLLVGFGPFVFFAAGQRGWAMGGGPVITGWSSAIAQGFALLGQTFALWMSAIGFLLAARHALWRRAFIQPKQRFLQFFRWLDGVFHRLNQNRFTKGIVLIHESVALPLFQPISWRETKKKTLGTTRYLIRFLMAVEPPLLFFLLLTEGRHNAYNDSSAGEFPNAILWLITTLCVTVLSTGLIAGEKTKQTLDVLLATPLTIREIVGQKSAGVRKMIFVMWIPLVTVLIYDFTSINYVWSSAWGTHDPIWWLIRRVAPIVVYPALIGWIGFHFGMRLRTQGQAMLATIGVITAWCQVPIVMHEALAFVRDLGRSWFGFAGWTTFSPLMYLSEGFRQSFWGQFGRGGGWGPGTDDLAAAEFFAWMVHFGCCGVLWAVLRWLGYRTFARVVQRNEGKSEETPPAVNPAVVATLG